LSRAIPAGMTEQAIELKTSDGVVDCYYYTAAAGSGPGVLFLTDIRGVRPATREMAGRLAQDGYSVLLVNVFYRTRKPPAFDFPFVFGEEKTMRRFAELATPLTPAAIERDAAVLSAELAKLPGVRAGKLGAVGHCFTGAVALRYAAACPDRIAAVASFHGGALVTEGPDSPHLVLPQVRASLYFAHAENDALMPAEGIRTLESALAAWGGKYESETYAGARHGWTGLDSPSYNEALEQRAHSKLLQLLAANLG
jgi:carboxymethylenebutenolidase